MTITDTVGAFVPDGLIERAPTAEGPLSGLTFALKDLFDLEGAKTGAGNPTWLATHPVATRSAPIVDALLGAGAKLVGKTITDEIAWSLNGENFHYGTPENVAAPGRIPGGSSAGSAAAVAAGLVDFAIGSDTGGSVRLPASYCGIYGLRPTHGRVSLDGAVALARSYDTCGWFARDAEMLRRVGPVLLDGFGEKPAPTRLLIAQDMFARAEPATQEALKPLIDRLAALVGEPEPVEVAGERAPDWREVFRIVQSSEAWDEHRDWVLAEKPEFGPGVKQRFEAAPKITAAERGAAEAARREIRATMDALVPAGAVLVIPVAPGVAPLKNTPEPELNVFRAKALEMLSPAGHAGLPQISIPGAKVDGCPVGLGVVAARGHDEALLDLAVRMAAA